MTIKELEERTGMTRANIRYYESEGLISPKRLDNGYRDYSEEDVNTLEKIRLLRELRLDIDAIRLVQKGSLTLEQALFNLLTRLEGEKNMLDRAVEVCRELERSGVEYGALDPGPWLRQLERPEPQRPDLPPNFPRNFASAPQTARKYDIRPREEWVEYASFHPFMRWLARSLDTALHSLVVYAVLMIGFHWNVVSNVGSGAKLVQWFVGLLCVSFTLLCEAFWLHFWGWTPGKRLFGLKLRGPKGEKVTLQEGFARSRRIFCYEFLFLVPLVNLALIGVCLYRLYHDEDLPWDRDSEFQYTQEEQRLVPLKFIVAYAAAVGAMVLIIMTAQLIPPHRGSLTAAEYYDNVNHFINMLVGSGDRLNEDGEWESHGNTASFGDLPEVRLETADGAVTAVILTETDDSKFVYQRSDIYQICLLALAAAEADGWPMSYDQWAGQFSEQWNSFEADCQEIHISQVIERSGYEGVEALLYGVEGQKQSYSRTVTIALMGDESG